MSLLFRICFVILISGLHISQGKKTYDGYKLIQVTPETGLHVETLKRIRRDLSHELDFWSTPSHPGKAVTLAVPGRSIRSLQNTLDESQLSYKVLLHDFKNLLKRDQEDHVNTLNEGGFYSQVFPAKAFNLSQYHRHAEISSYLRKLTEENPDITELFSIGYSYEGREILGIRIGKEKESQKGMVMDAGIHAREWAAPSTALYIIHSLVEGYHSDTHTRELLHNINFYIIPQANPDGYEYTWDADRYWRKTRSRQCPEDEDDETCCFGVDPNRNWDYHFGGSGTSTNPCSEIYRGRKAFSEKETQALAQFILKVQNKVQAYISLHSFSELWLIPYGYASGSYPKDFDEMMTLAKKAEKALEATNGIHYTVENSATLYPAAGASDDWAKGVAKIKYSYTIEVRPGEEVFQGENSITGFSLPQQEIIPTGKEILAGILVVADKVMEI